MEVILLITNMVFLFMSTMVQVTLIKESVYFAHDYKELSEANPSYRLRNRTVKHNSVASSFVLPGFMDQDFISEPSLGFCSSFSTGSNDLKGIGAFAKRVGSRSSDECKRS